MKSENSASNSAKTEENNITDKVSTYKTGGREILASLYEEVFGSTPTVSTVTGAGSDRKYYRLWSGDAPKVIGTWGENIEENKTFISLARNFLIAGLPVPAIYAVSGDFSCYLQEDKGEVDLLSRLDSPLRMELAEDSLRKLVAFQTADKACWEPYVMNSAFSRRQVMWDLNYFKYEFLKPCGILFDEELLEEDFEKLAARLTGFKKALTGFMYRDFQSRNIIVGEKGLSFIDFQGGRRGPLLYDAISFLWQAKAGFSQQERMELLSFYAEVLSSASGIEKAEILADTGVMALFRTLQVLGAYGFRGLVEKRSHFIESIPRALSNLKELLERGEVDDYPELKKVCERCVESRYAGNLHTDGLTVKVFSFSYKRGYPEDLTGNGGGFMFDCRGMHNPGRYDEYKSLTGLDLPVKEFLEDKGEVQKFVKNAFDIVAPSIGRYYQRGFSNLQIGFGCTGGRHRSVYCAEALGEKLADAFPEVRFEVIHREQSLSHTYDKKMEE